MAQDDKKRKDPAGEKRDRDPTARRGENEEGGSVSDADVGEDKLQRDAIGGYGGDTGEAARRAPHHDND